MKFRLQSQPLTLAGNTLVFDIETVGDLARALNFFTPGDPFDPSSVRLGNIKDPALRAEKIEQSRLAHLQEEDSRREKHLSRAALYPESAEVLAVAYQYGTDKAVILEGSEEEVIGGFFEALETLEPAAAYFWTGSNTKSAFDLNMLFRRSIVHRLGKRFPHRTEFVDVASVLLQFADWNTYYSLDKAILELGVEGFQLLGAFPAPVERKAGPVTGANWAQYYRGTPAERELALSYLYNDVAALRAIVEEMA